MAKNIKIEEFKTEATELVERPTVKTVQMHAGVDLIGSKTSIHSRLADIYERPQGLLMISKKEKRKVLVPYSNIRGYELL